MDVYPAPRDKGTTKYTLKETEQQFKHQQDGIAKIFCTCLEDKTHTRNLSVVLINNIACLSENYLYDLFQCDTENMNRCNGSLLDDTAHFHK